MKGFRSALYFRRGICLKIIPYHCSRIDIGLEIRHMPEKEKIIIDPGRNKQMEFLCCAWRRLIDKAGKTRSSHGVLQAI